MRVRSCSKGEELWREVRWSSEEKSDRKSHMYGDVMTRYLRLNSYPFRA